MFIAVLRGIMTNYPTIDLMHGFMGSGKTTLAKKMEKELPAVRFTHDEIMLQRYGRAPDNFQEKYDEIDCFIKSEAAKCIAEGKSVIMDYGFWTKEKRKAYYEWGKILTPNVVFCVLRCDKAVAKERVLRRTEEGDTQLYIDENCFETRYQKFEPFSEDEGYPVYQRGK